jgi:hypothetical protein
MAKKASSKANYYCVCVRRDYESIWRVVSKHDSLEEAESELQRRREYTGALNYDNAELRILSRDEAKAEFGKDWEYKPIGTSTQKSAK